MRVLLHTGAGTTRGGVLGFCETIRPHMGVDVVWFTAGDRHWGTPDRERGLKRAWRFVSDYARYAGKLRSYRPDVVHLNPSFKALAFVRDAIFLLMAKRSGARVVVFFHGWDGSLAERSWVKWVFSRTYGHADVCIVLCSDFERQLRGLGFRNRIERVFLPIADKVFDLAPAAAASRQASAEPFNILFLARVEREKGVFEALEAYTQLVARYPQATLTIAGEGSALPIVRNWITERGLPGVDVCGYVQGDAKVRVLQAASCCILPSYTEGLPTVVLEAMAFGLPIVTRPLGGLKDFFEDGKMGFLVPSLAPEDFASCLERLLTDPSLCGRMAVANREFAMRHFKASDAAQHLIMLYQEAYRG